MQNFFAGSLDTAVGPAWSLAVEVVFYLVLPPARPPGADTASRSSSRSGTTLSALVRSAPLFGVWAHGGVATSLPLGSGTWHSVLAPSFFHHADLFAFGMGWRSSW